VNGISERPKIQLMHRPVVDVAAYRLAIQFLLVGDEVLGDRLDARRLHPLDRFGHRDTREVRVYAEAFPVAPSIGNLAQRPGNRAKEDVDAAALGLGTHILATLAHQAEVPCRCRRDAGREGGRAGAVQDAEGPVLQAQLRVVDGADSGRVAHARAALVPADARHDVDLVLLQHLGQCGSSRRLSGAAVPEDASRGTAAAAGSARASTAVAASRARV
jgi:hypothetical protein